MKKLGLALSGGGYRAAAYHLGTLRKLQKLGILEKVDVLSTISGGSIIGAYYALNQDNFEEFDSSLYKKLTQKDVIKNVLFSYIGLIIAIIIGCLIASVWLIIFKNQGLVGISLIFFLLAFFFKFQFFFLPISKRIEAVYDSFFFENKSLSDLPKKPLMAIGSTNLQTFKPFTFSRDRMGDSSYSYGKEPILFESEKFPIARAVMASSCVPFAFSPVKIAKSFFKNANQSNLVHPILVDGGLYDNQGIHKLTQENSEYYCDTIIVSDAGGGEDKEVTLKNTFAVLNYTMESFMYRIKMQQMVQGIYKNTVTVNREITYCPLKWDVENCVSGFASNMVKNLVPKETLLQHKFEDDWLSDPKRYKEEIIAYLERRIKYDEISKPTESEQKIARSVGTNLTKLSKSQIDALILQAEAITEVQVRLYCPSLIDF